MSTKPLIGSARVFRAGWQYRLHFVRIRFCDTGSPHTFEYRNVTAVQS